MIGVLDASNYWGQGLSRLKRDILFFDTISILKVEYNLFMWRESYGSRLQHSGAWADDLEFLISTELFNSYEFNAHEELAKMPDTLNNSIIREAYNELNNIAKVKDAYVDSMRIKDSPRMSEKFDIDRFIKMNSVVSILHESLSSLFLSGGTNDAVSLDSWKVRNSNEISNFLSSGDILNLSILKVPVPNELTPWETIFEMKQDNDLVHRAIMLRNWSRMLMKKGVTLPEAIDMLNELIYEYKYFLSLHKVKTDLGLLQKTIVASGEIMEDFLKLKFGNLLSRFVNVKVDKANLFLAEQSAPGRELSIIPILQDRMLD